MWLYLVEVTLDDCYEDLFNIRYFTEFLQMVPNWEAKKPCYLPVSIQFSCLEKFLRENLPLCPSELFPLRNLHVCSPAKESDAMKIFDNEEGKMSLRQMLFGASGVDLVSLCLCPTQRLEMWRNSPPLLSFLTYFSGKFLFKAFRIWTLFNTCWAILLLYSWCLVNKLCLWFCSRITL